MTDPQLRASPGASPDVEARRSLALIVVFGVVYVLLSAVALHGFPFSGDEYSVFLQAEIFVRGVLKVPAPAHAALFAVDHVVIDAWVRSKYPPGTSVLLALGLLLRVPWLVAPVEAVAALAFLRHAARRAFGERAALVTVLVSGASGTFAFHAASFYSHTPVMMALAAAVAAVVQWQTDARRGWLIAAGAAVGFAFLTRPLDALAFAAALLVLRDLRAFAWIALGVLPVASLLLAYQALEFGNPFVDGYHAYEPAFRAAYGEQAAKHAFSPMYLLDADEQWHHLLTLRAALVEWSLPGAPAVALIGASIALRAADERARRSAALVMSFAATSLAALLMTVTGADDGVPSRYLSNLTISVAFLAGPGWIALSDALRPLIGRACVSAAAASMVVLGATQLGAFLDTHLVGVHEREGLYREVAASGLHDAVVIVRAGFPTRYLRNGPSFDGSVLYVQAAETSPETLAGWFPGRSIYEAIEGRPWVLRRVVEP